MPIAEDIVEKIAEEPISGVLSLTYYVQTRLDEGQDWSEKDYELLLEALALLHASNEAGLISLPMPVPAISGVASQDCPLIYQLLDRTRDAYKLQAEKQKYEAAKTKFSVLLGAAHYYEFSQGDLERIQQLINELREKISASTFIEPDHKQRLLGRLERLQRELHKKVSSLDQFWGLIGEAGIVIGKFGTDAKPIVDRIREIAQIVWTTQARMEELPSSSPFPVLKSDSTPDDSGE